MIKLLLSKTGAVRKEYLWTLDSVAVIYASKKCVIARNINGEELFVKTLMDTESMTMASDPKYLSLRSIHKFLRDNGNPQWVITHKAYLVNGNHIQAFRGPAKEGGNSAIVIKNKEVPVSRRLASTVRKQWKSGFSKQGASA